MYSCRYMPLQLCGHVSLLTCTCANLCQHGIHRYVRRWIGRQVDRQTGVPSARVQDRRLAAVIYQAAEVPVRVASSPDVKTHEVTPNDCSEPSEPSRFSPAVTAIRVLRKGVLLRWIRSFSSSAEQACVAFMLGACAHLLSRYEQQEAQHKTLQYVR